MKHQFRTLVAAAAIVGATAAFRNVQAAGFMLNEVSARGNALAGALVGDTGDATAIFYNPANMVNVPGSSVSAGLTLVRPTMKIKTQTPAGWVETENDADWWTLPAAFYSRQLNEDWWAGIGLYAPFGLGSQFDPAWPGRYSNYDAVIKCFNINPSIAWRVNDRFSIGAGLIVNVVEFQIKRKVPNTIDPSLGDIDFYLDSDWCVDIGGDIGVRYAILDNLQWGAFYRSPVHQDLEGTVRVRMQTPAGLRDFMTAPATCNFYFPGYAATGFNFQPTERWNLGLSVGYTEWDYYDELDIRFKNELLGRDRAYSKKNWYNVWRFAVGAEYQALDWLALRCGYVFDEEPTHGDNFDYMVPANDRHLINAGVGIKLGEGVALDLGYTYIIIPERDGIHARPAEGVYETVVEGDSHIVSASISWDF